MQKTLLIDVGGTNIETKLLNENKVFAVDSFKTDGLDKEKLLNKIAYMVNNLDFTSLSVKISSPTAVDSETGFLKGYSGIENYANFNLYKELKAKIKKSNVSIKALNDASCAMLGIVNANFKKTKPQSACLFALGTGIGGAVYINGKIFPGIDNMAGEFGYPFWNRKENVSLNLSPVNVFKKMSVNASGAQILSDYENDQDTKKVINEWIKQLVKFMNFYVFGLNPEYIFFSGGVTNNKIFQSLVKKEYENSLKKLQVEKIITTKIDFFNSEKINYSLEGANFI